MTDIYTFGFTEWYDKWAIEQGPDFKKLGRCEDYKGGSAFIGIDEAQKALKELDRPGFSLYKLDTAVDNLYLIDGNYHIVETCRILSL